MKPYVEDSESRLTYEFVRKIVEGRLVNGPLLEGELVIRLADIVDGKILIEASVNDVETGEPLVEVGRITVHLYDSVHFKDIKNAFTIQMRGG